MKNNPLPRLDEITNIRERLLPYCRLGPGEIWTDPSKKHRVGCIDAADPGAVSQLMDSQAATLAIHDPPYNVVAFETRSVDAFIAWCEKWARITTAHLARDAALYIWIGADQREGFQPLPDFMIMMRGLEELTSRSFITMRNQRGYGTPKNWMAVRQELLYYTKGAPSFCVQYTDIPKVLRGYYKKVNGTLTENVARSKSKNIRASNVWIDIQQVFYRMEENVSGCYAQKPLNAIDRLIAASSLVGDVVLDLFSHSGTTLLSCERLGRNCITADIDPVYCEVTIRRLEHFRRTGHTGWQNGHPFEDVLPEPHLNDVPDEMGATENPEQQTLF